jgi:hypothetical protein
MRFLLGLAFVPHRSAGKSKSNYRWEKTATLAQSSQAEPIVFDGPKNARSFVNWQEKFHYPKWVLLDD